VADAGTTTPTAPDEAGGQQDPERASAVDAPPVDEGLQAELAKLGSRGGGGGRAGGGGGDRRGPSVEKRRYAVYHDVSRPHVRLGIIWLVLVLGALWLGELGLAGLYGLVAAVGALQTAKAWRRRRQRPNMLVAGLGALAMAVAAVGGSRLVGGVVLAIVAAAVAAAVADSRSRSTVDDAAFTVRSSVFIGLAAASVVLVYEYQAGAALSLIVLASAYEAGDYVIGSGSPNPFEGPLAGFAAVAVLTFSLFVFEPQPFDDAGILVYGAVIGVLAPLGQLAASWLLPDARAIASGLRRLDTLLLAGPVWLVLLDLGVGQ
jgi:hypothetical protein